MIKMTCTNQEKQYLKKAKFKNILKSKLYFLPVYDSNFVTLKWKVCVCVCVCVGLWVTYIYTTQPKRTEKTQKCYKTRFILQYLIIMNCISLVKINFINILIIRDYIQKLNFVKLFLISAKTGNWEVIHSNCSSTGS